MQVKSILRFMFWLLLVTIGAVIVIPVGLFLSFNPNDFKQEITTFISEKSGLPLEIHGKIEMTYLPRLGFSANDVSLRQEPQFGKMPFIQIKALSFKMPVRALLKRQVIVESLTVNGLQIHLIKKQDGSTNWESYTNRVKHNAAPNTAHETQPNTALPSSKKKLSFKVIAFALNDANITFENAKDIVKINDFSLSAHAGKSPQIFPIRGKFKMLRQNANNQIILTGQSDFEGSVNLSNTRANINTTLDLNLPQNTQVSPISLKVHADMDPDLISLSNIHLKAGEQLLTGKADIPVPSDKPITFNLNMKQLDLDKLTHNHNKTSTEAITRAIEPKPTTTLPKENNKQKQKQDKHRAVKGNISIDKLITKNLKLNQVKATVQVNNGYLKANPITADLYQGKLSLAISKDLNKKNAPITLQGDLRQVEIQPLLNDLKQEKRIVGTANVNFNLVQNQDLEGIVKINIFDGKLDMIDLRYYLALAQSLLKKEVSSLQNTKQTPFGNLSATLNLHNKMIDNNDLTINASDFSAKGEGSLYLGSQTIEYKVKAWRLYRDNEAHPNAYPLAIRIKGSLQHPKIEPDMDLYLKKGLEQQVKKQLNKQIEKKLDKLLGNGGSQEASQNSAQEILQQKIEDKLNKGLKRLFKKKGE